MESFNKLLREINENINNVIIFNVIIRATLFFLTGYFILSLFNFYPSFAIIPSIMYLIILLYLNFSKNKAKIIGNKYPYLKEKLITSYDYKNADNEVVYELKEEVVKDMRNVRISEFINQKSVFARIFFIVILSFMITIVSLLDLTVVDVGTGIEKLRDTPNSLEEVISQQEGFLSDIFGEDSNINSGSEEIKVEIRPIGYEIDVRQLSEIPEEPFGENSFPQDVFVTSSESFQEDFSKDKAELIKEYFEKLSKT